MNNENLVLGSKVRIGIVEDKEPQTIEERLARLEEKLKAMIVAFNATKSILKTKQNRDEIDDKVFGVDKNRDGIPIDTVLFGVTKSIPYILIVNKEGEYIVGNKKYTTLSSAAEEISGVRRSGWVFWKLPDGRTAKEVFRKR